VLVVVGVGIGVVAVLVLQSQQTTVVQRDQAHSETPARELKDKPTPPQATTGRRADFEAGSRAKTLPSERNPRNRAARGKQAAADVSPEMSDRDNARSPAESKPADPRPGNPRLAAPAQPVKPAGLPATEAAKPAPPAQSAESAADSARTEAVRKSLQAAREALAARELDKADEQLDLADLDASTSRLRAKVAGVRTLRHFVDRFWNAVRESMASIKSGAELTVDGETVIVVEFIPDSEKLFVRMNGQTCDYTARKLPASLAVALAEHWLDPGDRNSPAFIGAFLALSGRKDEAERGRRMLAEAKAAGSDVAATVLDELGR